MNPAVTILLFYGLLALAIVILRGDLSDWPRWADRTLSFAVALSAVALLLTSWRPAQPPAETPSGPPAKPSPNWPWWAGMVGFLGFVYLAALPPVSTWLAQPQNIQRWSTGRDATKPSAPGSTDPDAAQTPSSVGGILNDRGADGPSASAASGVGDSSPLGRLRELWRQKPPWLTRLALAAALVLIAVIAWLLWRLLRPPPDRPVPPPGQQPLWFEEPHAPRYVREFARLCQRLGSPPRPGETFRDLLGQLSRAGHDIIELMPMTAYHYRVRYENASPNRTAERAFSQMLRARRKGPISAPARETGTEVSAAH